MTELCAARLPKAYGYSPISDIQVLCPSRKGDLGTVNLNRVLQGVLNPPEKKKQEITINGRILRTGDKVMQTKIITICLGRVTAKTVRCIQRRRWYFGKD